MNGEEAFDWLVENHYMEVNQLGLGTIVKPPSRCDTVKPPSRRDMAEIDMFVKCVVALGAHSVTTRFSEGTIAISCGCGADDLRFQKRWQKT